MASSFISIPLGTPFASVLQVLGPVKPGRRVLIAAERSPLALPDAAWRADLVVGPAALRLSAGGFTPSPELRVQELGACLPSVHTFFER